MSTRKFDRFMVANDNGRSRKLAKLTDAEFRALVQGIWPIASEATPRGAFMVGRLPATADDVVFTAPKVSKRAAASAIAKLRELGMLEHDPDLGGEWVHDWDALNPSPKTDNTNADRQKRWRERQKQIRHEFIQNAGGVCAHCDTTDDLTIDHITPRSAGGSDDQSNWQVLCRACNASKGTGRTPRLPVRNGNRTPSVTPPEVEGEVKEEPPLPPDGGRRRDTDQFVKEMTAWSDQHFPGIDSDLVKALVGWLRSRGVSKVTPVVMRDYAEKHDEWSGVLGSGLSDEQRQGIADIGARVVAINTKAAS